MSLLGAAPLLASPAPAGAQMVPTVEATPTVDHVTIGDRITVQFTVRHTAGTNVLWPDSLDDIAPFEQLTHRAQAPTTSPDGSLLSQATYEVAAFELGELTFPGVTFPVVPASGDTMSVESRPFPVVVATVGLEGSGDIRGIKPPLGIPLSWTVVAAWFAAAVALVGAAWLLYRRWRRRDRPVAPTRPASPPRPAHTIAFEALDRVERSSMLENGEIERWFLEVTEIIRIYIENRYSVHAMEMATSDILRALESLPVEYRAHDQFRAFFERADLVKFAKHQPSIAACRALLESARALVDATREREIAETPQTDVTTTAPAA